MRAPVIAALAALPLLMASPRPVSAAPFCLQISGVPPQCMFYDVAACRRQAERMNAVCALNPDELMPPPGGQRFCQVSNGPVIQCLFPDRRSCDAATARSGGICIDGGDATARPDPDLIPR